MADVFRRHGMTVAEAPPTPQRPAGRLSSWIGHARGNGPQGEAPPARHSRLRRPGRHVRTWPNGRRPAREIPARCVARIRRELRNVATTQVRIMWELGLGHLPQHQYLILAADVPRSRFSYVRAW